MTALQTHEGWELHETGSADAERTVLLIPGGMCTAAFYDDVVREPTLTDARVRCVAVTVPGFGGARPVGETTIEGLARVAGDIAAELGCDGVVGHSIGANIALEMVAAGHFRGPVLLLEPAFSREDEFKVLAVLDRLGRVPGLGHLVWAGALRTMGSAMKDELPPERLEALVDEMKQCDAGFCRRMVRQYFAYLDQHGSLVSRLCDSGARAVVVFCDRSEVGLTAEERAGLEACPAVEVVDVADSGHMIMSDQPARTAELIAGLVGHRWPT
jgi:pimeloyl-ACP methyl ester carboxylesterase